MVHARYTRHRRFARVRRSTQLGRFLQAQATRLGVTPAAVLEMLRGKPAAAILRTTPATGG